MRSHVEGKDPIPLSDAGLLESLPTPHADVDHQPIQSAKLLHRRLNHLLDTRFIGGISGKRKGGATLRGNEPGGLGCGISIDISDGHRGSLSTTQQTDPSSIAHRSPFHSKRQLTSSNHQNATAFYT